MKSKKQIRVSVFFIMILFVSSAVFSGITPLRKWAPRGSVWFKTAAACQFNGSLAKTDVYAVFAVFTVRKKDRSLRDELWYLAVNGWSASPNYGEIIFKKRLAVEEVISHVDCTSDGTKKAYVVWDRSDDPWDTENARWACLDILGGWTGPNEVPSIMASASFGCGIAYHDGTLAISACGRGRCQYRSYVWPDVTDPASYAEAVFWYDGQSPKASDIIWNGEDGFLMAHLCDWDLADCFVGMVSVLPDGSTGSYTILEDPSWPTSDFRNIYLVYSDNRINADNRVIVQTDRAVFWTDQWGNPIGSPEIFRILPSYPACEYWGRKKRRIANVYSHFKRHTIHGEWPQDPSPPGNLYRLRESDLGPVACCSSSGFKDSEVLLIRKSLKKKLREALILNFEPQD